MDKVIIEIEAKTGKAGKELDSLKGKVSGVKKEAGATGKGLTSGFSGLKSSIASAVPMLGKLKAALISSGIGAVVVALGSMVALFKSANETGAKFQKSLSTLKAVASPTADELGVLSNQAKELGASTQFTAIQVVELQTELAKLGFTASDIANSTPAILDLAASLEVDLASAAELAGSTVRSFGLDTQDTQKVVDVMALSTSSSALNFESLRESLKLVAPTSRATGVSIEKTAALLGVLANNGLKGSVAGTGLSKTFIELNKKGITLEEGMEKIKNSTNKLNTAIDLVGVVGAKSFLSLAESGEQINQLEKDFLGAEGSAKKMSEVRLDNLAGDTTKLGSAWEGFLLSIEDGEGIFNRITRGIVKSTTAILNFITPTKSVTDELEDQRFALFKSEVQLDSFDKKINDTTTSEKDLLKAQRDRIKVIDNLQDKYPNFLKNIDSETVSTEDLKRAIDEVNSSLINKILIQERQEEIQDQAEESADALKDKFEKEKTVLDSIIVLRKKYSDLGIEIKSTSPNDVIKELNEISIKQNKLRLEGNEGFVLGVNGLNNLNKETARLTQQTNALNKADKNFNDEQEKGNKLLKGKNDLIKKLGIEEEVIVKKAKETKIITVVEETEDETAIRLKAEKERAKALEEIRKGSILTEDDRRKEVLLKIKRAYDNRIKLARKFFGKKSEEEALLREQGEIAKDNQQAIFDEKDKIKADAEKKKNDDKEQLAKEKLASFLEAQLGRDEQDLKRQEAKALAELHLLGGTEKQKEAIRKKFAKAQADLDRLKMQQTLGDAKNTLNQVSQLAGKDSKIGKAMAIASATISGVEGVQNAYSTAQKSPITAVFPAYPIVQSALAGAVALKNISAIKSINPSGQGGAGSVPTVSGGGSAPNIPSVPSLPPAFNVVGASSTDQLASAIGGQSQQPVQAFVVSGDISTSQELDRNIISGASI